MILNANEIIDKEIEKIIDPIKSYKDIKNREQLFAFVLNKYNRNMFITKIWIFGFLLFFLLWFLPIAPLYFVLVIPWKEGLKDSAQLVGLIFILSFAILPIILFSLILCKMLKLIFLKKFHDTLNKRALKSFLILSNKRKIIKFINIYTIHPDWNFYFSIASIITKDTNQVLWGSLVKKIYNNSLKQFTKLNDIDIVNGNEISNKKSNITLLKPEQQSPYFSLYKSSEINLEYISIKYFPQSLITTKTINNYQLKLITLEGCIASCINQLCFLILKYPESEKLKIVFNDLASLITNSYYKITNITHSYNLLLINNGFLYFFCNDISGRIFTNDKNNLNTIITFIQTQDSLKIVKETLIFIITNLFNDLITVKLAQNIIKLVENKNIIIDLYYEFEERKIINFDNLLLEFSNIETKNKMLQAIGKTNWLFEEIVKEFEFLDNKNNSTLMLQYVILKLLTSVYDIEQIKNSLKLH